MIRPYVLYKAFYRKTISRGGLRALQYCLHTVFVVGAISICCYQNWTILPCGFVTIVALIYVMKTHSFVETQLELFDKDPPKTASVNASERPMVPGKGSCGVNDLPQEVAKVNTSVCVFYDPAEPPGVGEKFIGCVVCICGWCRQAKVSMFFVQDHCLSNVCCATCETSGVEGPSLRYFVYYLCCPVLVYETCYPCCDDFRWRYVVRKVLDMLATLNALYMISVRFLIPVICSTASDFFLLGLARLMWPLFFCYFLMFYFLFECLCNLLAELTYFGHRDFYHDWWNSTSFEEFSRRWNRPVYEFLCRHVYHKMRGSFKVGKPHAAALTFFVSALFHELIMMICFKHIGRWFLFGLMMLQVPLIMMSKWYTNRDIGNSIFWVQLILGVPLIAYLYGRDYTLQETRDGLRSGHPRYIR